MPPVPAERFSNWLGPHDVATEGVVAHLLIRRSCSNDLAWVFCSVATQPLTRAMLVGILARRDAGPYAVPVDDLGLEEAVDGPCMALQW